MKKIIIASSLVLILIIIIFSINYTVELDGKKIKINGTTYALTIDDKAVTEIPSSGNYYLTNYSCDNGSIITWDRKNHTLKIRGTESNTDSCYLDFETTPLLNEFEIGDYVAYVGNNGCNKGVAGTTGTGAAEAGNSCLGENANQSTDTSNYTYGYCSSAEYKYYVYGWRIAYIENNKVYLISAGSPECRTRTSSTGNATQIADLNTAALDYCNKIYADGGTCSSLNTWAMNNSDFQKITYAISGTSSNLTSAHESPYCDNMNSSTNCGYNNDLIDNGGYYWFADYSTSDAYGVLWNPHSRYVFSASYVGYAYGFRPIIKLSSEVFVTGGSGTMEEPYEIGI